MNTIIYNAYPTTKLFHASDKFVRGLMGPIGSGKSVACCWELFKLAQQQEPDKQGRRRTRWAIIRNTYRELVDTTMRTWFDWFPEESGVLMKTESKFTMNTLLPDGTTLEFEILFRALDKPKDVKKLLSLELTGAWVNEAREIPKQIIDMLQGRAGRFPSKKDGGPTWHGVIMDTNPPDDDHWWYKIFEEHLPSNWELFRQPSALSDKAENKGNLVDGYYENMMQGKDSEWIKVYVEGEYGFIADSRPVYPQYNDAIHYDKNIKHIERLPVHMGIDFGLTPAVVFVQKLSQGRFIFIDEIVTTYADAYMLGDMIKEKCRIKGYKISLESFADPAGNQRSQADSRTPFETLASQKIFVEPTHTNDPYIRIGAVNKGLTTIAMDGKPRITIGPLCIVLRKGFRGGYSYKRMQVANSEIFKDEPEKNRFSHIHDGAQYIMVGLGLGDEQVYGSTKPRIPKVNKGIN